MNPVDHKTIGRELDGFDSLAQLGDSVADELWAQRRRIARIVRVGLVVSLVFVFLLPSTYTATARLMPPDQSSSGLSTLLGGLSGKSDLLSLADDLLGGMKTTGPMFIGIMQSESVQDRIIDRFDLQRIYGVGTREQARKELAKRSSMVEDRKSGIITVSVEDNNPVRAAHLARAYIDELDRAVGLLSTSSARRERIFLEKRLQSVKQELDNASRDLAQYSSEKSTLDPKALGEAIVSATAKLEAQRIAAEAELAALQQTYKPEHPKVRAMAARVNELKSEIAKMSGASGFSAQNSSDTDGSPFPSIRQLPIVGLTYVDLYRRAKIDEAVYEGLTKQYELAKVQEAKEIPVVRVLDEPLLPERHSGPPRVLLLVCGVLLSGLLGSMFIWTQYVWNRTSQHHGAKRVGQKIAAAAERQLRILRYRIISAPGVSWVRHSR